MIKHSITYYDLDGEETTAEWWFNLTTQEIREFQLSTGTSQGYFELVQTAAENNNGQIVNDAFTKIIRGAVGRREGKLFVKNDALRNEFEFSGAFSALLDWMLSNPLESAALIAGILPQNVQDASVDARQKVLDDMKAKLEEMALEEPKKLEDVPLPAVVDEQKSVIPEAPYYSDADLAGMSQDDLQGFLLWRKNNPLPE